MKNEPAIRQELRIYSTARRRSRCGEEEKASEPFPRVFHLSRWGPDKSGGPIPPGRSLQAAFRRARCHRSHLALAIDQCVRLYGADHQSPALIASSVSFESSRAGASGHRCRCNADAHETSGFLPKMWRSCHCGRPQRDLSQVPFQSGGCGHFRYRVCRRAGFVIGLEAGSGSCRCRS